MFVCETAPVSLGPIVSSVASMEGANVLARGVVSWCIAKIDAVRYHRTPRPGVNKKSRNSSRFAVNQVF